jgi:hypothetical protein
MSILDSNNNYNTIGSLVIAVKHCADPIASDFALRQGVEDSKEKEALRLLARP